ncbi:tRNA (adenosine(37)-N6)-threonylcarbamoyltransferase complex ATPase subunit type 1 TsaE [Breoghania sp. L-A4]|uniref:tRNA (adenosine(37)-N6)-threonylcarbamoyltransferase complex ATPase subunit type 1 TsaE n=1 Tax=Breoghania sp. L-A4 TaxID=2304600 RepID=UPI000E358A99|nr:tRNA (adenosine(37)-N6)-threonylcarbamoyltransferase complex ATPase subunit type 1 TsaE [Breoghania sp. L-A4]AXS39076.1 tRNA (adenosine(37)-N6)-threonylcarbamoyltransferase complex ATPase subunit type 1 TsaE [Breoghania sp. L-A4]
MAASLTIDLPDEAATRRLAEDLALILRPGDVVALHGDLGAGKSTLARAVLRALADDPDLEVPSPTFTLVQAYAFPRLTVSHFDLYRIEHEDELEELGFEEAASEGAALVEWPQRAESALPADTLLLSLSAGATADSRVARLDWQTGDWEARLGRTLRIRRFLDEAGWTRATRRFLLGDASTRSYERIARAGRHAILMNAPQRADGPPVRDGKPYSQIAHLAEDVRAFVGIGEGLRARGFHAPELFAHDMAHGLLLLEDLGAEAIVADGAPLLERYAAAIDLLAELHTHDWPDVTPLPGGGTYRVPAYDAGALSIEAELYLDWYVPDVTGGPVPTEAAAEFKTLWAAQFETLARSETTWVLRDFHSPNLIWRPQGSGTDRLALIDYQDTVIGPTAYDVASLAQDARVTIPHDQEQELVARYVSLRRAQAAGFDADAFRRDYAVLSAHRATKILGIFVRLDKRDGKPGYRKHIPRLRDYLARSLEHPALADIKRWYQRHGPAQ